MFELGTLEVSHSAWESLFKETLAFGQANSFPDCLLDSFKPAAHALKVCSDRASSVLID